jgi:two-component system, NtrC family, response regulator HydG
VAKILLVDDDIEFLNATEALLGMLGHEVDTATSVKGAKEIAQTGRYSHVILDLLLPDGSGLHLLDEITGPDNDEIKIAFVTGHSSVKSVVSNLYGPNIHYLLKPVSLDDLKNFISKQDEPKRPKPTDKFKKHFEHLIGESAPMQQLYEMIERVSATAANVMLIGESGVGKEVVAASIHQASNLTGELVAVNCGAFAADLINSELFGHEKGAFTGAISRKIGVFEQAQDGTLFLDEVTEMPIDLQPNLLRALESRKITRLGSTSSMSVNCRVISATNRSESEIAQDKRLREDLYFRLAVFPIYIPPLRHRKDDIPLLVKYFLAELNSQYDSNIKIAETDLKKLCDYDWPGNLRELRHCLHRAYIMADQESELVRIPEKMSSPFSKKEGNASKGIEFGKTVEDVERELILTTLDHLRGDKKAAAETLGLSLKTLYNRLNEYQISTE